MARGSLAPGVSEALRKGSCLASRHRGNENSSFRRCWPRNTIWNPERLQDPLAAWDWKQRNERQTVLGCWGGRGPNLSVLTSFPPGWDLGERQIQILRQLSGRRRPELEDN